MFAWHVVCRCWSRGSVEPFGLSYYFGLSKTRKIACKFLSKFYQRILPTNFLICFSQVSGPPVNSPPKFTPKIVSISPPPAFWKYLCRPDLLVFWEPKDVFCVMHVHMDAQTDTYATVVASTGGPFFWTSQKHASVIDPKHCAGRLVSMANSRTSSMGGRGSEKKFRREHSA